MVEARGTTGVWEIGDTQEMEVWEMEDMTADEDAEVEDRG